MTEAVNLNSSPQRTKTSFLANAQAAYGDALPDWVEELAKQADCFSGAAVAKRLGYSGSVVTSVCKANYGGDLATVEGKVRGLFMGMIVECPVLGDLSKHRCLDEQKKTFIGTSALRTSLFHACRGGCPNARIAGGVDG